ncbi:MAG: PD-(D/E)XK nuclease family protein [Pseudomonadota bacterium]
MLEPEIEAVALGDSNAVIVTSGQRLASTIRYRQSVHVAGGVVGSWVGPDVCTWDQFLRQRYDDLLFSPDLNTALPSIVPAEVERVLWQQSIEKTAEAWNLTLGNVAALARESARTWRRAIEWRVSEAEIKSKSTTDDGDFFVASLFEFCQSMPSDSILESQISDTILSHSKQLIGKLPGCIYFAGFSRLTPQQQLLFDALPGVMIESDAPHATLSGDLRVMETPDDELRAAGQWARRLLEEDPRARLAIVVPNLSERLIRCRESVLDGLVPLQRTRFESNTSGWLNVSLGTPLAKVPAVRNALNLLEWTAHGGSFAAISRLDRCHSFWADSVPLERLLRRSRDRHWTPEGLGVELDRVGVDAPAWLVASRALAELAGQRHRLSAWIPSIATLMEACAWLGGEALDSERYQLRSQFYDAVDLLQRVDAHVGPISLEHVVGLISSQLAERTFAPEQSESQVLLCGPLETAGMTFDAVWIAGMDSTQWPPPGKPLALLSAPLQRAHEMPDASPEQTRRFWSHQWHRLLGCAGTAHASYAAYVDGRERLPAPVVSAFEQHRPFESCPSSLQRLLGSTSVSRAVDHFPVWPAGKPVRGGHHVLRLLGADPFLAQVTARWGVAPVEQPEYGIGARTRGILIHTALELMYNVGQLGEEIPTDAALEQAVSSAFRGQFAGADPTFRALLRQEEARATDLIREFVLRERARAPFRIHALESTQELRLGSLTLQLRADRIDLVDGGLTIIDYKTGAADFQPDVRSADFDRVTQLAAYALASELPISAVVIASIHPRNQSYRGLYREGQRRMPDDVISRGSAKLLEDAIPNWTEIAQARAAMLERGEGWLNLKTPAKDWLVMGPLSRLADVRGAVDRG